MFAMKVLSLITGNVADVIIYCIILFVGVDYFGIIDYSIKAFIGSLIWFCFKVAGDRLVLKYRNKLNNKTNSDEK